MIELIPSSSRIRLNFSTNPSTVFTKMCGASIPQGLLTELTLLQDDPHAVLSLGVAHATAQCLELLQRGAPGIHFYTLNKSSATRTIFGNL